MYRIVHNALTKSYRVEKLGFFGWSFVIEQGTGDYLQFDDLDAVRKWVADARAKRNDSARRWKVVTECHA